LDECDSNRSGSAESDFRASRPAHSSETARRGHLLRPEHTSFNLLQDETAGIYLPTNNLPALSAGQLVEIEGVTSPGEFAPVVTVQRVTVLGTRPLPPAKPVSFEELVSGGRTASLSKFGRRSIHRHLIRSPTYNTIEIVSGGGRFKALIASIPPELKAVLVDSKLKVRGVCASHFQFAAAVV
jgi:hypothetical protein